MRRMASDHAALHRNELPPYYLFPANSSMPDDLTQLTILLAGPQGTPYAGGLFKLHLKIPHDYPKSPPKAAFKTKIWHPNVEESTGSVCLDTLKKDWQSTLTLRDILIVRSDGNISQCNVAMANTVKHQTISCLLIHPNPDSALNFEAGKLIQEDFDSFARQARLMTSIHAPIPPHLAVAVQEARTRGEVKAQEQAEEPDDEIYVDENEDQENDPSLSPSPIPTPTATRQNSVLGKRPLSELPTPVEPESEDEDCTMTDSQRNIVANTPNLSSNLASMSFNSSNNVQSFPTGAPRRSPKLMERSRSVNFAHSQASHDFLSAAIEAAAQPAAKRICGLSDLGKENAMDSEGLRPALAFLPQKHNAPIGLGVHSLGSKAVPTRKPGMPSGISKPKPRVGLRRL